MSFVFIYQRPLLQSGQLTYIPMLMAMHYMLFYDTVVTAVRQGCKIKQPVFYTYFHVSSLLHLQALAIIILHFEQKAVYIVNCKHFGTL